MAKRLMILATLLAAMLPLMAPAALAQEVAQQQYSPEGPPAAEEFAGSGMIESITGIDGGYGLKLPSGEGIYLEGDFDFESFVGQEVYVEGVINTATDGARIMTVESIEPIEGTAASDQYSVEERDINFELSVEGEPPAGAAFSGAGPLVGLPARWPTPTATASTRVAPPSR